MLYILFEPDIFWLHYVTRVTVLLLLIYTKWLQRYFVNKNDYYYHWFLFFIRIRRSALIAAVNLARARVTKSFEWFISLNFNLWFEMCTLSHDKIFYPFDCYNCNCLVVYLNEQIRIDIILTTAMHLHCDLFYR